MVRRSTWPMLSFDAIPRGLVMKRVLVTGGSGFIGRRVLARLAATGFEVHAVSRQPPRDRPETQWHELDLADHAAVNRLLSTLRPSHLLHLAWAATYGDYYHTAQNVLFLRDSLTLIDGFIRSGGQRIVGAGTSAEYDLQTGADFIEGETPLRPNGLYGLCKKALFEIIGEYSSRTQVEHAWGRVFFCYGPGEHASRLVPTVLRELETKRRISFPAGTTIRDYLHVDDVADAFATLVGSDATGAFNIGSGDPLSLKELVEALAERSGHAGAVDFGALPTPSYEPARVVADTTRIRTQLGWRPARSLGEGLSGTISWWRERWSTQ